MFTIQKGVPITDGRASAKRTKYPWDKMEVGDCFDVSGVSRSAMYMTAKYQTERTGRTYKASKIGDVVRVWRLT